MERTLELNGGGGGGLMTPKRQLGMLGKRSFHVSGNNKAPGCLDSPLFKFCSSSLLLVDVD